MVWRCPPQSNILRSFRTLVCARKSSTMFTFGDNARESFFVRIPVKQLKKKSSSSSSQVLRSNRTNLSPFTKDFRVRGTILEKNPISLKVFPSGKARNFAKYRKAFFPFAKWQLHVFKAGIKKIVKSTETYVSNCSTTACPIKKICIPML